jgi:hypothetical protein
VIRLDGIDSVNEGGGTFSWFAEGCIVGDGVSYLIDSGEEADTIELLLIVIDIGDKLWL